MSYVDKANHLAYFAPQIKVAETNGGVLKVMDIGASSADHGELICVRPCKVVALQFTLTEEAASGTTTAPTVIFTKRPTPNSATGEAVVETLVVPSGSAIGKTVYLNNFDPVSFAVGQSMELSHTVGVGTPTGIGVYSFICIEDEEDPRNNSNMILSA
jgi:hypothetical protein